MKRNEILGKANQYVSSDRNVEYGEPEDNFGTIARLWAEYKQVDFTAHDVAVMMILLKVGRIANGQEKMDNYIDIAGYAACAGELVSLGEENDNE